MLRPLGDCVVVMPPIAIDLGLLEKLLEIVYRAVKDELPGIIESCDAD
jgi:adenosylmethionine-8-amino-7-oxononanoate aminotransferase